LCHPIVCYYPSEDIFNLSLFFKNNVEISGNFFVVVRQCSGTWLNFIFLPKRGEPLNLSTEFDHGKDGGTVELSPFIPRYGRTVRGKPSTFHRVDYGKDGGTVELSPFIPSIRTYGAGTRSRKPRYVRTGNRVLLHLICCLEARHTLRMLFLGEYSIGDMSGSRGGHS
jgi:hypothetical protein